MPQTSLREATHNQLCNSSSLLPFKPFESYSVSHIFWHCFKAKNNHSQNRFYRPRSCNCQTPCTLYVLLLFTTPFCLSQLKPVHMPTIMICNILLILYKYSFSENINFTCNIVVISVGPHLDKLSILNIYLHFINSYSAKQTQTQNIVLWDSQN